LGTSCDNKSGEVKKMGMTGLRRKSFKSEKIGSHVKTRTEKFGDQLRQLGVRDKEK
jgi:hypothetical protein